MTFYMAYEEYENDDGDMTYEIFYVGPEDKPNFVQALADCYTSPDAPEKSFNVVKMDADEDVMKELSKYVDEGYDEDDEDYIDYVSDHISNDTLEVVLSKEDEEIHDWLIGKYASEYMGEVPTNPDALDKANEWLYYDESRAVQVIEEFGEELFD